MIITDQDRETPSDTYVQEFDTDTFKSEFYAFMGLMSHQDGLSLRQMSTIIQQNPVWATYYLDVLRAATNKNRLSQEVYGISLVQFLRDYPNFSWLDAIINLYDEAITR